MSEQEAFCALVRLMEDYDVRGHYTQKMIALHRRLYQFEKLIDFHLPDVAVHLRKQGVRADMYASQWFLTFFAYKCPLSMVGRVFDIVFAEGVDSLLRIGIALLKANQAKILRLDFDHLLGYLKTGLFAYYEGKNEAQLFIDAGKVRVTTRLLRRYRQEFESEVARLERQVSQGEQLRQQNRRLEQEIHRLQEHIGHLTGDHTAMAQHLVQARMENAELRERIEDLETLAEELKTALRLERSNHMERDKEDLVELAKLNMELQMRNAELERQASEMAEETVAVKMRLCEVEMEKMELENEWREERRRLIGTATPTMSPMPKPMS